MGELIWELPMPRRRQRKCRHCGHLYEPDTRNRYHQRYCSQPACRQASKAASRTRWRASAKGWDYFRGSANVLRVQAWRKAHPATGGGGGRSLARYKITAGRKPFCRRQIRAP